MRKARTYNSYENPNLSMKVFYQLKDQRGDFRCLEEDEAHLQISKLRASQPEKRSKFKEIFDRARANRLPK